jgi:hypothetical protein
MTFEATMRAYANAGKTHANHITTAQIRKSGSTPVRAEAMERNTRPQE